MTGLRLNIGCGSKKREGYVNLDIDPRVNPDKIFDLSRIPWNFVDQSVDEIYVDNVVEHLKIPLDTFLSECRRVLKRGGRLHIIMPNCFKWRSRIHFLCGYFSDGDGWDINHSLLIKPSELHSLLRHKGFAPPIIRLLDNLFLPQIDWIIRKREDL